MAKQKEEIVKTASGGALVAPMPDYLSDMPTRGMEEVSKYVVFPRMKVVQKMAGPNITAVSGPGDLITVPDLRILRKIGRNPANGQSDEKGPPVLITPVYFFVEWMTWNPIALKGQEPAVYYRTRDPEDPLVAKSRSPQKRVEPYRDAGGLERKDANGQSLTRRNVEHLNWIVVAHDGEGVPVTDPFVMSFSRAEHFTGTKFATLVKQRRASPFLCQFEMLSSHRPNNGKGDWYGVDLRNPEGGASPWVTREMAPALEKLYEETRAADKDRVIRTDTSDAEDLQQDLGEAEVVGAGPNAVPRSM